MQLSTNRVNFTNNSVAQFNYVTFLSQFRSRRKGLQDIGNIVRLHNDDFALLKAEVSPKYKLLQTSKCVKNDRALVLYVRQKKLRLNATKHLQWYRFQMFVLNSENHKVHIECDLIMAAMEVQVYIRVETTVVCELNLSRGCDSSDACLHKSRFQDSSASVN